MSTGTTLRLFMQDKSRPLPENLYGKYLERVNEYNNTGWGSENKELKYPKYIDISDDSLDRNIWIYNDLDDFSKKPELKDLFLVQSIGATDFTSEFNPLVDYWNMSAYSVEGCQHILSNEEISKLEFVLNYLTSSLMHTKDAKQFEKVIFANNPYFQIFANLFPSRFLSKEFKRGDNAELIDEELCAEHCCKRLATFINYFLEVSDDYSSEFKGKEFKLVYFKW